MPIHFTSFRNYRGGPSDSDDDEREQDEGPRCGDSQVSASRFDEDENHDEDCGSVVDDDDDDDNGGEGPCDASSEPATWADIREQIISDLFNPSSDIHLILSAGCKYKKDLYKRIYLQYAPNHPEKSCVGSIERLVRDFTKKSGRFSEEKIKEAKEKSKPFFSSKSNKSPAWQLLYHIMMNADGTILAANEIYEHHEIFKQYEFADFKNYVKDMAKLTTKHLNEAKNVSELFEQDERSSEVKDLTSRGKKFWRGSQAKESLFEDTSSGRAGQLKPKELWQTRPEYQEFPLEDFRKHYYQEKYRQIAGPYWQRRRNIDAMKQQREEAAVMYKEWRQSKFNIDMDALADRFDAMS